MVAGAIVAALCQSLERRGLVETRVFPGERGRGGRVLKVKIFYEKDIVRRQVDDAVMKTGKN